MEKEALEHITEAFRECMDEMEKELKDELEKIKKIDASSRTDSEEQKNDEVVQVDSFKIEALQSMIEDYENIINKNFCLFSN